MTITVRPEQPEDAPTVRRLVIEAYAGVVHSDHREHLMVERLRGSPAYLRELSLLAEVDGHAAGHLMLTRIAVADGTDRHEGLALAPLSVAPPFQGQGVGARLVRDAHRRAAELAFPFIVLVGPPDYYRRFGYGPLDAYPVTLPFDVPPAQRMLLHLAPGPLTGLRGEVEYAPEWLHH
jgi:predicted N-acetyltransferase YhbS